MDHSSYKIAYHNIITTMIKNDVSNIHMTLCRICLNKKQYLYPLFHNADVPTYGEMLNDLANVKVFAGDGLPDKICCFCSNILKSAYKLKQTAEKSDSVLRNRVNLTNSGTTKTNRKIPSKKMSFNSITDIKSALHALNQKTKSKPEIEIMILDQPIASKYSNPEALNGQDIVICNTVIRKIESHKPSDPNLNEDSKVEDDFIHEDAFEDDTRDEDFFPPEVDKKPERGKKTVMAEKMEKTVFKISSLEDVRAFKEKENLKRTQKNKIGPTQRQQTSSYITYCPLLENGKKGQPVYMQRPTLKGLPRGPYRPRLKNEIRSKQRIHKPRERDCCPVCGVLTFSIKKHLLTHAEKKPFQCEQCLRSFVNKSCFEVHMKKHKGIRDHICDICGAAYYSLKSVKRHRLIHNGERKYACTLCDKKFLLGHSLRRHQEIHAGYKPYKCTACLMSFHTNNQLRNHMLTHTGDRPYSCEVCNVKFGYKVNLNNHVTRVHGINLKYKSIHTVTEEVIERESKAMDQAKIQADALLTVALQIQPEPVPEDQITTHIVFHDDLNEL